MDCLIAPKNTPGLTNGNARASHFTPMSRQKLVLILAVAVLSATAVAQISPGPLSRAHQELDGATHCTTCHKLGGGEPAFRCLDCHAEIASRLAAHRGAHSSYGIRPGSSQECAKCHSDHNGLDFPIVKWDTKKFDHKQTGYLLEGKHAGLECGKCHAPDHIPASERALIKVKDLKRTFLGVSEACATCHKDPHAGRLGPNCAQCHNFNAWKNVSGTFDHSKTRYPLTGQHAPVKCEKCHTPGPDNQPRYMGLPFGKCDDCHSDPHKGSFARQSCQSCHTTGGWKRIVSSGLAGNFDHSKTKYPLLGKHQAVECIACHANGDFKKELPFAKCMDCHKDAHNGQFAKRSDGGECASCHDVNGWKPSKFDMKAHASTAYPLEGKHAKLECAQCHVAKGRDTLYKVKFSRCMDCHHDEHQTQFAASPWLNQCEKCHTLEGFKPSTFALAKHKQTRFQLAGSHLAVLCSDCHKPASAFASASLLPASVAVQTEPTAGPAGYKTSTVYHFRELSCTTCHQDPHRGQFAERMRAPRADGTPAGCEACHSTKNWQDITRFDHDRTRFALLGAHRAVACIDCHRPPNLEMKLTNVDFTQAPTKCEECHSDIHGRQFAKAGGDTPCADCHNTAKWKPSLFDHDKRTAFALAGAHKNVRCADCHKLLREVEGKQVLFYKPTPKDCRDCHGTNPKFQPKS
ncbi:MAG: hypothetical protein LAO23_04335 [Acidobacteriia bacterium]|nr:hypothetical protein [Terriglobia bacterium]